MAEHDSAKTQGDRIPHRKASIGLETHKGHTVAFDASPPAVQALGRLEGRSSNVHKLAIDSFQGPSQTLPGFDQLQVGFAPYDLSGLKAYVGEPATIASAQMGAMAYAREEQIAFSRAPSLFAAAHDVAHVVQQRQGVNLYGDVGKPGDRFARQA